MTCHVYDERSPTCRFGCALFRQRFSLFGGISLGLRDSALGFHMSSLWTNRRLELFLPSCEGGISRPPFVLVPRRPSVVSLSLSSTDYRMVLGSHSVSSGVSCFAFTPDDETSRVTSVASAPEAAPVLGVSHESLVLNIHVARQP